MKWREIHHSSSVKPMMHIMHSFCAHSNHALLLIKKGKKMLQKVNVNYFQMSIIPIKEDSITL